MAMELRKNLVVFRDVVSVDDAERLLEWLQKKPSARVDFAGCTHLHPANLQVLMAAVVQVHAWPTDAAFAGWLKSALELRL